MNDSRKILKFKAHFKNLNFYSMPVSILFIVRKRLNFAFFYITIFFLMIYGLI